MCIYFLLILCFAHIFVCVSLLDPGVTVVSCIWMLGIESGSLEEQSVLLTASFLWPK